MQEPLYPLTEVVEVEEMPSRALALVPPPGRAKKYSRRGVGRETPDAAKAFEVYYDLGEDRSLKKAAEINWEQGKKDGDHEKYVRNRTKQLGLWSVKFGWQQRIIDRDRAVAERKRRKREREQERMNEEHAELGGIMATVAAEHIEHLRKIGKLNAQATVLLFKEATALQRQAVGAATEIAKFEIGGENGEAIKTESQHILIVLPQKHEEESA